MPTGTAAITAKPSKSRPGGRTRTTASFGRGVPHTAASINLASCYVPHYCEASQSWIVEVAYSWKPPRAKQERTNTVRLLYATMDDAVKMWRRITKAKRIADIKACITLALKHASRLGHGMQYRMMFGTARA